MGTLAHEKQIVEYEKTLAQLKESGKENGLWSEEEIATLEAKLEQLRAQVYSRLTAWERVAICRHPQRPRAIDYIRQMTEEFVELFGDRLFRDDPAVICGLAKINGMKCMIVAQEKGNDTKTRLERNFGMPHPEGYRKAMRCMRLAAKFHLPVLSLLDTPGAYAGLAAEERGQAWAIANNLLEMARLPTPIIVLLVGEGCSGGALGMGIGDVVAMLEHSYYSVISPESCASIIWRDSNQKELAATALKMHAEDLLELGVVDQMLEEPLGGAHQDPALMYVTVKKFVGAEIERLQHLPIEILLEQRYQKFRKIGKFDLITT